MKTNAFKGTKETFSLAKKSAFALLAILTLVAVSFGLFSLTASANTDIRVENYNNCEKYLQLLGEEINAYIELDTEPSKTVSKDVTQAINKHRNELLSLQTHPDIEKRSLEKEILLAYTKGTTAGRLAWIYYYNIYAFTSDASASSVSAKYEACVSSTEASSEHTVLSAECEVLCAELNGKIYVEKAQGLAAPSDSLTSKALISGAIESIKLTSDPSLRANELSKLYQALVNDLLLQRTRDGLIKEMEAVFLYVRPSENSSSSSDFALFAYNLEKACSIKEMNSAALSCISALISPDESKKYSSQIKQDYLSKATTAANRASENQTGADFSGIFEDYPLTIKKSLIKDSIFALFLGDGSEGDDTLRRLEVEFNGKDGRIDLCKSASEADSEFTNAKASLFLHKHAGIYEKPLEDLSADDEVAAKNALIAYSQLEVATKSVLLTEINIIAEKYNIILKEKILSILPNDSLYLDLSEEIINELNKISRNDIDVFYNKSSRIPEKAYALASIIKEYREIISAEHYAKITAEESAEISKAVEEFSKSLSSISTSDLGIYSNEIEDAKAFAIRAMNAASQCARVRIAGSDSSNPAIDEEIKSGCEKIRASTTKSEIVTQADRAIFKIRRHLTSDGVINEINTAKEAVSSMQFLTEEEKIGAHEELDSLLCFSEDSKIAENLSALESLWNDFLSKLEATLSQANAIDLSRAITAYAEEISKDTQATVERLENLEHVSKSKRDEIYNSILEKKTSALAEITECKATSEVKVLRENLLKSLEALMNIAENADLEGYKASLVSEFAKYEAIKGNYSKENYNKIIEIQSSAKEKIKAASSKQESKSIIEDAHEEISKINDLLDDEKIEALSSLAQLLEDCKVNAGLYSTENLSAIEKLCDEAKIRIQGIDDIEKIASVKETLTHYFSLIKAINKDVIYTSEDAHSLSVPTIQYPQDYDFSLGLWGCIESPNALLSDSLLTINKINVANIDEITELIQKSAKNGSIISASALSNEELKLLSSAKIVMSLDISLSKISEDASEYKLKLLLPPELLSENVLGIAFVNSDGGVEFYPVEQINSLACVNLSHLSRYYIVAEGTLNIKPLLIFLILLIVAEFIVLALIIYIKKIKNKRKGENAMSNLPMAGLIQSSIGLTRIYPENGIILAIFLSIAGLALGVAIVLLLKKDVITKKKKEQDLLSSAPRRELLGDGKKKLSLKEAEPSENDSFFADENKSFFAEEGNSIFCQEKIFCTVGAEQQSPERSQKAEIDLDTIAKSFSSNETVNMQSLKSKGLVASNVKCVKILAKGSLTKPLRIEANEFSEAAKQIIELSGGQAREI